MTAPPSWIADTFDVPVFLYGPVDGSIRTLPELRKMGFRTLMPDKGPKSGSPTLGASAVGARNLLVAWNLWLRGVTLLEARAIAHAVRREEVRALAFQVGDLVQVSCNLVAPLIVGPSTVYDRVTSLLPLGGSVDRAELVGLAPRALLAKEDRSRWSELDLSEMRTIESGSVKASARLGSALNGPGPAQTATLALAHPTPDAELLAVVERVLQAVLTRDTPSTHFLRFAG